VATGFQPGGASESVPHIEYDRQISGLDPGIETTAELRGSLEEEWHEAAALNPISSLRKTIWGTRGNNRCWREK
jgi:hypothetical protein